jgi:hypothetical protein
MQGWANQVRGLHELSRVIPHTNCEEKEKQKDTCRPDLPHGMDIMLHSPTKLRTLFCTSLLDASTLSLGQRTTYTWRWGIIVTSGYSLFHDKRSCLCWQPAWKCLNMRSYISCRYGYKQGVRHTVALPFTFKSIWRQKKNYGNSNISPCKNYNLQNNPLKETKILQDIRTL